MRSMPSPTIRAAQASDAVALAELCGQLGYPTTPDALPPRLTRLDADPAVRTLVATTDGMVIGLATVHIRYTINHEAPLGQLTLLVVDERVRARGIGRALVAAAEAWAREQGCKRFVVTTALHRNDAHAFYEKLGFKHTGRRYGKDFS
jgi:N-acetylglutamate synthase-like GNAT family acetyltransferase